MAGVCFFILVAISVGLVTAKSRNCDDADMLTNCDECIRCGGTWCLKKVMPRCSFNDNDDWCSNILRPEMTPDSNSDDNHVKKTILATQSERIHFPEPFDKPQPQITFVNSSIDGITRLHDDDIFEFVDPSTMSIILSSDFCPAQGRVEESLTVKLEGEKQGEANSKFVTLLVPCACSCSSNAVVKSDMCSWRGNYSCGICICEPGWKGETCAQKEVTILDFGGNNGGLGRKGGSGGNAGSVGIGGFSGLDGGRGDVTDCENQYGEICSGKGKCVNGKCICFDHLEGSQYFDENRQCMDLCLAIESQWDACIADPLERGQCSAFKHIYRDDLNRTRLSVEKDSSGRKSWVNCSGTTPEGCDVKYTAKRDSDGIIRVMFLNDCNLIANAVHGTVNLAWPVGLGVIGVILAASAVAGFMLWKNRTPPLPLNDPGYGKIDAEDCTGMNPLYKPPTSSFKNPTYGKW